MNWVNRLERRFGRYAISNLIYYVIGVNFIIFLMMMFDKTGIVYSTLNLDPELILRGEIWRLVTFIFIPPNTSPLWILFTLYVYYLVGSSLEREWGSFKFNIYYLIGMVATIATAFITGSSTGFYLNLSLYLAFAFLFPNFEFLIFFVLPVKVKYLAALYWIYLAFIVITGSPSDKIAVLASVVNFFVFFGTEFKGTLKLRRQVHHNRKRFFDEIASTPPIHTCAVCGITEKIDPKIDFFYCKTCGGFDEYCAKHINDHQHQNQETK